MPNHYGAGTRHIAIFHPTHCEISRCTTPEIRREILEAHEGDINVAKRVKEMECPDQQPGPVEDRVWKYVNSREGFSRGHWGALRSLDVFMTLRPARRFAHCPLNFSCSR